jgi:hypothetical protein
MIRYKFAEDELIAELNANDAASKAGRGSASPRRRRIKEPWLAKARRLTAELKRNPDGKITSIWSEVKKVYTAMRRTTTPGVSELC